MFKRNHVFAIAAMAAFSMLSLTACSDENSDITNVPDESELSSSSTPSVESESSSSGLELSSSSAPSIESSSSSEESSSSEKSPDRELTEADVKCSVTKPYPVDGDECSYKTDDGDLRSVVYAGNRWREFNADSTINLCSESYNSHKLYKKSGADYYYCVWGKWLPAVMVPQQYMDSRKEGLSDEEYDVLDLPQNASMGDRAEGTLERCVNGVTLVYDTLLNWVTKTSAYCVAENHYRYRSNGTWTLETDEDLQNDSRFQEIECTEGNLGTVYERDGLTYKCVNVQKAVSWSKYTTAYDWRPGAVVIDASFKRSTLASPTEVCNESNDGKKVVVDAGIEVSYLGESVTPQWPVPLGRKRELDYQCKYDSEKNLGKWELVGDRRIE